MSEMSLTKEINEYLESKRDLWSPTTLHTVGPKLRAVADNFHNPYSVYKRLVKENRSKYTIKVYLLIASKFEREIFGTKKYEGFLKRNTTTFKNCYKDKVKVLSPEKFDEFLLKYINTKPDMYNLLLLMGTAGLRVSEALNLTWEDVIQDGDDSFIRVVGKGDKQRLVPFSPDGLIVTKEKKGKIIGKVSYRFLFDRDLAPYTPHDLRAHYATYICNHPELNVKDAAALLGHSSINTTMRYVRSDLKRVAKVLKKKK
jgi:integrase